MPALEGITLGHYHLKRLLGRGGMAEVYLAVDDHLRREVAIKVVHSSHTDALARFRREAELLASLTHEHILPIYDCGEQDPWHYLVLPYLDAGTLGERVRTHGPLSLQEAGLLLDQIADALQYAHERGILHRDIKPSNILLRDDSFAYVADFGIAKAVEQGSDLTQTGFVLGTPEYMAPDLLERPASPSSEVYALGSLLYFMLTGQTPFTGPTALAILQQHLTASPLPPAQLNPAISPPVEHVVLRALEKEQERRYATPQALANAYRQAFRGPALLAPAARDPQPGGTFYTRNTTGGISWLLEPAPTRSRVRRPAAFLALAILGLLLLAVGRWTDMPRGGPATHAGSQQPSVHAPTAKPSVTIPIIPAQNRTPTPTKASVACAVTDTAHLLNQAQVCQAAHLFAYPIEVYTTNTFQLSNGDFDQLSRSLVTSPQLIVIAIRIEPTNPTPHVHVDILGGIAVPLADPQYHSAMDTFTQVANQGNYTQATIKAIRSLQAAGA
jgi:serine/threonine protein kinase